MKSPYKATTKGEKGGGKRLDPSGKNRQSSNLPKMVRLSCELKLKVPVYKVPVCEPSIYLRLVFLLMVGPCCLWKIGLVFFTYG